MPDSCADESRCCVRSLNSLQSAQSVNAVNRGNASGVPNRYWATRDDDGSCCKLLFQKGLWKGK